MRVHLGGGPAYMPHLRTYRNGYRNRKEHDMLCNCVMQDDTPQHHVYNTCCYNGGHFMCETHTQGSFDISRACSLITQRCTLNIRLFNVFLFTRQPPPISIRVYTGVHQTPPRLVGQNGRSLDPYPDAYPTRARCVPRCIPRCCDRVCIAGMSAPACISQHTHK